MICILYTFPRKFLIIDKYYVDNYSQSIRSDKNKGFQEHVGGTIGAIIGSLSIYGGYSDTVRHPTGLHIDQIQSGGQQAPLAIQCDIRLDDTLIRYKLAYA